MNEWLGFAAGAVVSGIAVPLFRARLNGPMWIDQPKADRHHVRPVSRAGGPAWLLGFITAIVVFLLVRATGLGGTPISIHPREWAAISLVVTALVFAFVIGRTDDSGLFSPSLKWRVQVALLLLTLLGLMLTQGEDGDPSKIPRLRLALSLVVAVMLQLALNIADNLDGALGAAGLMGLLGLAFAGHEFLGARAAALAGAGATAGFLIWNLPPARVFLGNGGSEMIALLASLLLAFAWARPGGGPRWSLLLPFAWPLFDLAFVVLRRWKEGRRPWDGGRDHSTHVLSRRFGGDRPVTTLLFVVAGLGFLAVLWLR